MKKIIIKNHIVVAVTLMSSACTILPQPTHNVTVSNPPYDPTHAARVRFLSGNGTGQASFRPGEACYQDAFLQDDKRVNVNDGFLAAWKYSSDSLTIGMPQSPRPNMRVEGLEFKDFIKEYVVQAEKPITVNLSVNPQGSYCNPPAVTFIPQPGRDYDIFVRTSGNRCWVAVQRIDNQGMDQAVTVDRAQKCSSSSNASN